MAIWLRLLAAWLAAGTRVRAAPRRGPHRRRDHPRRRHRPRQRRLRRARLNDAPRQDAAVIVLRMDTPGGLDSAMRDIIRSMLASPVPSSATSPPAAPAPPAPAPISSTPPPSPPWRPEPISAPRRRSRCSRPTPLTGPAPAGKRRQQAPADTDKPKTRDAELVKITNDAVAYIRGLATLHGRNADWAEKAVREAVSLPYDAALDQHVIDLVADDLPDLLAKANGRTVHRRRANSAAGHQKARDRRGQPGLRDRLLSLLTDPSIVYLLLLAGLFGIAFEASHPGIYRARRVWRDLPAASAPTGSTCCRSTMPGWRWCCSASG